MYKTNAAEK